MKEVLRYLLASFTAALAAMVVLALILPLYVLVAAPGSVSGSESLGELLLGSLVLAGFVIVIGGMIALPAALLAGGALLLWQRHRGAALGLRIWLYAGLAVGAAVSLTLGANDPPQARLAAALWFAASGATGAWVFRRVWVGA
jgi:hypothetical protein